MRITPRSGFTLVELLVVIGVIAVITAMMFPVFAKAREKARTVVCASNLKQLGNALDMYTQDYDELLPGVCLWDYANDVGYGYANVIYPYVKSNQVYICPSAGRPWGMRVWRLHCTYGYNSVLGCDEWWTGKWYCSREIGARIARVQRTAELAVLGETDWYFRANPPYGGCCPFSVDVYCNPASGGQLNMRYFAINPRHIDGSNVLYVDWHVKREHYDEQSPGGYGTIWAPK